MKKNTIVYKNEKHETLDKILDNIFDNKDIIYIEIYSKIDDCLFAISLENGVVTEDSMSDFYLLIANYREYVIDEYAVTGCNFQAIIA